MSAREKLLTLYATENLADGGEFRAPDQDALAEFNRAMRWLNSHAGDARDELAEIAQDRSVSWRMREDAFSFLVFACGVIPETVALFKRGGLSADPLRRALERIESDEARAEAFELLGWDFEPRRIKPAEDAVPKAAPKPTRGNHPPPRPRVERRSAARPMPKTWQLPTTMEKLLAHGDDQWRWGHLRSARAAYAAALELSPTSAHAAEQIRTIDALPTDIDWDIHVLRTEPRTCSEWEQLAARATDARQYGLALACFDEAAELAPGMYHKDPRAMQDLPHRIQLVLGKLREL